MGNLMPHEVYHNLYVNLDTFQFVFDNTEFNQVTLLATNKSELQPIRNVWRIVTVDLMHHSSHMTFVRNGARYEMSYECGYRVSPVKSNNSDLKIWSRPITPHHIIYCLDNSVPMSEAVKNVKMTAESFKNWNKGRRPDHYGEPVQNGR